MDNNGKFLSSTYCDKTITSIIEEAINGKFQLTFIDRDTGAERILSRGDLSAIRDKGFSKKAEVEIEPPASRLIGGNSDWSMPRREIISYGRRQNVGFSDLRASGSTFELLKKIFGGGDKGLVIDNLEFHIDSLTPQQVQERKLKIQAQSLEQRAESIKQRGFDIYKELGKKYPRMQFTKEDVAQFIRREEKSIYESLNQEVPPVASYLKHTRKPQKIAERSTS